jgi:hypothetical protein
LPFPIGRSDVLGIVFCAAILGLVLFASLKFPGWQTRSAGFGPDWECTAMAKGDPVCIKKPPKPPATPAPVDQPAAR